MGKKITGNSGVAVLTSTAGAYSIVTSFANTNAIASGSWQMYALKFDSANGITLNGINVGNTVVGAAYSNKVSPALIGTSNHGLWISPDGTKMYNLNHQTARVVQYTLTTPHDISTVTHTSLSFLYSGTAAAAYGLFFSPDGTRMYIHAQTGDVMYQFTLSTAFDVSTAAYANLSFDTTAQSPDTIDIHMKSDGTMWYHIDENDYIYQYSMSTAWNISTSSFVGSYNSASQVTRGYGLAISTDGTKMYIQCDINARIFQYTLSTPHTVSTASYDNVYLWNESENATMQSMFLKADGKILYTLGNDTARKVYQYTMGGFTCVSGQYHPAISNNGGQIDSTYWNDINTMTADQIAGNGTVSYAVSTDNHAIWKTAKNGVGIRSIARNNSGTWQYNSAFTPLSYSIGSATVDAGKNFNSTAQAGTSTDLAFKPDGTKMYVLSKTPNKIFQYSLSTAWDVTTASYDSVELSLQGLSYPQGFAFKSDGTKVFAICSTNDRVYEYTISTGWNLATGNSAYAASYEIVNQDSNPTDVTFNNDGTKMYVVGNSQNTVFQYTLSTAWSIQYASYASKSFDVGSQEAQPSGAVFNADGTKMFLVGTQNDGVFSYSLSTAFDVSTASYDNLSLSVASEEAVPMGIFFKPDGNKLFIVGGAEVVHTYSTDAQLFTASETWVNGTVNNELATIQQSLNATSANVMDKAQLEAVTDPNHFALGTTLDLMIAPYMATASASLPSSDGVSINYDAAALNKGAILGTDYDYDFPASNKVRITSLASQNLKVRVV